MDIDENILQCEGGEEYQVTVVPCKTQHSSSPSHCRECSVTSLLHAVATPLDYSVQWQRHVRMASALCWDAWQGSEKMVCVCSCDRGVGG